MYRIHCTLTIHANTNIRDLGLFIQASLNGDSPKGAYRHGQGDPDVRFRLVSRMGERGPLQHIRPVHCNSRSERVATCRRS